MFSFAAFFSECRGGWGKAEEAGGSENVWVTQRRRDDMWRGVGGAGGGWERGSYGDRRCPVECLEGVSEDPALGQIILHIAGPPPPTTLTSTPIYFRPSSNKDDWAPFNICLLTSSEQANKCRSWLYRWMISPGDPVKDIFLYRSIKRSLTTSLWQRCF